MALERQPPSPTRHALLLLAGLTLAVALQAMGHAYGSDLAANPDEAAHFVTGLMARDYLLSFPWRSPLAFARDFYSFYPQIGIGHWPPGFYVAQALWMAIWGGSMTSALILMALVAAVTTWLLVGASQRFVGLPMAVAVGVLFLMAPLTLQFTRGIDSEMPVTLLVLLAALVYARYLTTRQIRDAVWFGVVASAAIMTKANGLALALLPPIAILLARQTRLAAERSFWIPAAIVVPVCAPWYVLTARLASDGWSASYDPAWLLQNPVVSNAIDTLGLAGVAIFTLACGGCWIALRDSAGEASDPARRPIAAAMAALALSTWIFVSIIVPVREARHLLPILPPILLFAAVALHWIAKGGTARWRPGVAAMVAVAAVAPLAVRASRVPAKPNGGSKPVATAIAADRGLDHAALLVSSEWYGEGIFIATLAAQDQRPQHRVLRASKVLSSSNWNGSVYELAYASEAEVDAALRRMGVEAIVIDARQASGPNGRHHRQLLDMLAHHPTHWQALAPSGATGFTMFRALHDVN